MIVLEAAGFHFFFTNCSHFLNFYTVRIMKNLAINSNSSALNGIVTIIFHSQGFFVFSIFHLKRSTDNEIVQKMRDNIQIWFIGNHILVKALIVSLSRHSICYTRSTCCLAIVCIECSVGFIGSIVPYRLLISCILQCRFNSCHAIAPFCNKKTVHSAHTMHIVCAGTDYSKQSYVKWLLCGCYISC